MNIPQRKGKKRKRKEKMIEKFQNFRFSE